MRAATLILLTALAPCMGCHQNAARRATDVGQPIEDVLLPRDREARSTRARETLILGKWWANHYVEDGERYIQPKSGTVMVEFLRNGVHNRRPGRGIIETAEWLVHDDILTLRDPHDSEDDEDFTRHHRIHQLGNGILDIEEGDLVDARFVGNGRRWRFRRTLN